jgi:hypothetical protein
MKKLIVLAIIGSQIFAGCSRREVLAGIIGVGIGLGLARHHDHHDGRRHHRRHYNNDRYTYYTADLEEMAAKSDAQRFANKHHIGIDTATKIQKAFTDLPTKGLGSFASIGLGKSDLKALAQKDLPSTEGIKNMADKLDMSQAQARDLLVSMTKDFEAQASNVDSSYWKSCMQDGKWKTPQNASCQSLSANGCSPQTGASMCY